MAVRKVNVGGVRAAQFESLAVDEVLRRIHKAAAKGRSPLLTGVGADDWPDGYEMWAPFTPATPKQEGYVLHDLLKLDDVAFLVNAYNAVLRRGPDLIGFNYHLNNLRSGSDTKLEIVMKLRFSPEGVSQNVPIYGLGLASKLHWLKGKRYIGRVVSLLHAVVYLPRTLRLLNQALERQSMETQHLGRLLNQSTVTQARRMDLLGRASSDALRVTDEFDAYMARLQRKQTEDAEREAREAAAEELKRAEDAEREALKRAEDAEREALKRAEDAAREASEAAEKARMDALYSAFEDRFRGGRDIVRARVEPYVDIVSSAGAGSEEAPVVDVGCGRGEWLELLKERGLHAFGIDLNDEFAHSASGQGLKVIHGDAIVELRNVPAGSVGAVSSMHLVEHLPFDRVVALIESARVALRDGGVLILETPNPENIDVATHYFYMDPTHRNPLPPEMLRWVVEACGFSEAKILRLSEHRPLVAPEPVSPYSEAAAAVNHYVARTRVAPDYAIVATK